MANKAKNKREKLQKELKKEILIFALVFVVLFGGFLSNMLETFPTREELTQHSGIFSKLEHRKFGRSSRAYGLVLENDESFYIHPDFDADEFKRNISRGDELHLKVADMRQFSLLTRIYEPVVYEIQSADGMLMRDYESTLVYLQEMRIVRMITYGILSMLFAGVKIFMIHKLRRTQKS